jgi:hypothetical protein
MPAERPPAGTDGPAPPDPAFRWGQLVRPTLAAGLHMGTLLSAARQSRSFESVDVLAAHEAMRRRTVTGPAAHRLTSTRSTHAGRHHHRRQAPPWGQRPPALCCRPGGDPPRA